MVLVVDTTKPVIQLIGAAELTVEGGAVFTDPGAAATDNYDGDITAHIVVTGSVNTAAVGAYLLTYNVSDAAGNAAIPVVRTVHVVDTTAPVIQLAGTAELTVEGGSIFMDPGVTATDNCDGDISADVVVSGSVNTGIVGDYTLTYNVSDVAGNVATPVVRTVHVVDTTTPVIQLVGATEMTVESGSVFTDPGAMATDNCDGDITAHIVVTGSVNTTFLGIYTLTYDVSDTAGNVATSITRTIHVVDTTKPFAACQAVSVDLGEDGTASITAQQVDNGSTDGQGIASMALSQSMFTCANLGVNTVTLTVTDTSGNTDTCEAVVTISDPDWRCPDTEAPVITLEGEPEMTLEAKVDVYTEPGAIAQDERDGDISPLIVVEGEVDSNLIGDYPLTYSVSDAAGNLAIPVIRKVHVVDSTPPSIVLEGESDMRILAGGLFAEPGYSAWDIYDGDLTSMVDVSGTVDENVIATYPLQYRVSDSSGNPAVPVTRLVHVYDDTLPVIQLMGAPEMTLEAKVDGYTEPGASASDAYDGDLTSAVMISGMVNPSVIGDYPVAYDVQDRSGNAAPTVIRMIHVRDTRLPVITLLGSPSVQIEVGTPYTDAGATAADLYDGDISTQVIVQGTVNTTQTGVYYVTYTVSDSSGNPANPVTRIVQVLPIPVEGEGEPVAEGEGEGEIEPVAEGEGEVAVNITVPNVIGMTRGNAEQALAIAGLMPGAVVLEYSSVLATGSVIRQTPTGGMQVSPGSTVSLVVSKGPQPSEGEGEAPSEGEISAEGEGEPTGEGELVGEGEPVVEGEGEAPELVAVPGLIDMLQADAEAAILSAGLVVGTVTEGYNAYLPAGMVFEQNPLAGVSVAQGSAVSFVVSKGPQPLVREDEAMEGEGEETGSNKTAGCGAGDPSKGTSATDMLLMVGVLLLLAAGTRSRCGNR